MSDTSYISIRDLRKTFVMGKQKVHALAGVDLDIPEGSFTIIMGPSGSGKSTLLYLLGGLDRPTSGSIVIDGAHMEKMDENQLAVYRRKMMGFIFQSFNLVSSMTAVDNVSFPLRFSGVSGRVRRKTGLQLLAQVGLEKRAFHKPTELSGGQQQRVAVARALVNQPRIIFGDEPTGNLDTQSGFAIMQTLADLHAAGKTIVVVTHDPRMRKFATNIIYLLDGLVVTEAEYTAAVEYDYEAATSGEPAGE
jgi:putative ABC transport system ATP-binding protein